MVRPSGPVARPDGDGVGVVTQRLGADPFPGQPCQGRPCSRAEVGPRMMPEADGCPRLVEYRALQDRG
jgi:hypothetical protein